VKQRFLKKHLPTILAVSSFALIMQFYLLIPFGELDNPFMQLDRFIYHELLLPRVQNPVSPRAPIVVVAVNDADLQEFGAWPWSRDLMARGIEALNEYEPAVVGYSILIDPNKHTPQADKRFFAALGETENLVAGFRFDFTSRSTTDENRVAWINKGALEDPQVVQVSGNDGMPAVFPYKRPMAFSPTAEPVAEAAEALGFVDFDNPRGLLVYPMLANYNGNFYQSYPFALASTFLSRQKKQTINALIDPDGMKFIRLGDEAINTLPNGTILLRPYKNNPQWDNQPFPNVSFSDLVHHRVAPESLKSKLVILDLTAAGYSQAFNFMQDAIAFRSTIQATAVANLLEQDYIRRDWRANAIEIILILLLSVVVWISCRKQSTLEVIGLNLLTFPTILWLLGYVCLDNLNLWILSSYPLSTVLLGFTLQFGYRYFFEDKQRRTVERALAGYTSKAVMDQLIEQGESFLNLAAERRELTILLFDVKGFTQIAHRLTPEETFKLLNHIFSITDSIITDKHLGMIDKKMGDACIAIFGLSGDVHHPMQAVRAALEIQQALFDRFAELTRLAHKEGFGTALVQVRVGISSGSVCLGNVGSDTHFNFTAVGEVVNLAQRLESACPAGSVLISEETYKLCKDQLEVKEQHAKGKRDEEFYLAYQVLGVKDNQQ
jgi:adenylate cyclase